MKVTMWLSGWMWVVLLAVAMVCVTVLILNLHPFVIRFEMDDNSLAAVRAINWTAVAAS